jgi:acetyl esterase/lipase
MPRDAGGEITMRSPLVTASLVSLTAAAWLTSAVAAPLDPVLLWPGDAPQARGNTDEDRPAVTPYLPPSELATGTAVIVCPGGGYVRRAEDHEGRQVAEWLNSLGVAAFVLRYRVGKPDGSGYQHPVPLMDAQRALRVVRARARDGGFDPDRVGLLGFSAGGHLASTAGTHFDHGRADAADAIERLSSRPSFLVLLYPVISLRTPYVHRGSRQALLGPDPDPRLVDELSNETQVTTFTPPTFLVHTTEDTTVPPENSLLFYRALREAGVPAELHIYERGRHGLGLAPNEPGLGSWPERCREWMRLRGLLDKR